MSLMRAQSPWNALHAHINVFPLIASNTVFIGLFQFNLIPQM